MSVNLAEQSKRANVCVIGLGYIGLPTAVVLADNLDAVAGFDIDEERRRIVREGASPFVEDGLGELLEEAVTAGELRIPDQLVPAEQYVIAVPTPILENKTPDLSFLFSVIEELAPFLRGDELVIIESTCPPGTTEQVQARLLDLRPDLVKAIEAEALGIAYCPERVLPGNVIRELRENDRIIGGVTSCSAERAKQLYSSFCEGRLWTTDSRTAEMSKLAENAYRDVNIAFANQLDLLCTEYGVDVWELRDLANRHPRVNILEPGPGVGGHCIAVDPWFLVNGLGEAPLIETARQLNDAKPAAVTDQVLEAVKSDEHPNILSLGLSFKENVDDVRQSPAVEVVKRLSASLPDAMVTAVDPVVSRCPTELLDSPNVRFTRELPQKVDEFDAVVVLVGHRDFKKFDVAEFGSARVIDTRGLFRERQE